MSSWDSAAFDRWLTTDPENQPPWRPDWESAEVTPNGVVFYGDIVSAYPDEYVPYDRECDHSTLACAQPDLCECGCVECVEARNET